MTDLITTTDLTMTPIHKILASPMLGSQITLSAWVKQIRLAGGGKMLFIHLGDGHSTKTIQVLYDVKEGEQIDITFESAISVTGVLVQSPSAGQQVEIRASKISLIGGCDSAKYPLVRGKVPFTTEYLRKFPHLRPKTGMFSAITRVRDTLSYATQQFFHRRDFYWIHTPILTTSDCEGAGETFHVSSAKEPKFFGEKQAYLTVSGQLQLEPFACAMSKVYVFGPSFRAEKSTTSRHLSEFWMLEPEIAFADLSYIIKLSEEYIKYCIKYCMSERADEIHLTGKLYDKPDLMEVLKKTVSEPFAEVTYDDAIKILTSCGKKFEKDCEWGVDFGSDQERYLCEEHFKRPTYITHYPSKIKAFYMFEDDFGGDRSTVSCVDLLMPGIGEIIGGSQREHRVEILEKKMDKIGLDKKEYQYYLDTRRFGGVPHAGFGVGFDRLLRFITGADHIMDVVPYPVRYEHL